MKKYKFNSDLYDIVTKLRFSELSLGGQRPSVNNYNVISECIKAWIFLSEDIMIHFEVTSYESHTARIANFIDAISVSDFTDVINFCDGIYKYFVNSTGTSYDKFKAYQQKLSADCSIDGDKLLSPIVPAIRCRLLATSAHSRNEALSFILPWLKFPTKLTLQSTAQEEAAIADYLSTEARIKSVDWAQDQELLDYLEGLFAYWLKDFKVDMRPRHGGGSVADLAGSKTLYRKFQNMKHDKKLEMLLVGSKSCDLSDYTPLSDRQDQLQRSSKTVMVPKNIKKLRTISMEPVTLQYYQQGVMQDLYSYFARHPYLSQHIKLDDSTYNNQLAYLGSISRSLCTIDLSAASDSVIWPMRH